MIGPSAPVRSTGPSSISTPAPEFGRHQVERRSVIRQRSALPGVGRAAFGENPVPADAG